jgi:hypothetical protein
MHLEKTLTSAILFTTNPTCPGLGSNPGSRSGKPNACYSVVSTLAVIRVGKSYEEEQEMTAINCSGRYA